MADATYTAECPGGRADNGDTGRLGPFGGAVTVTRQYRSTISLEHARAMAQKLAKCEAEQELRCQFISTQCVPLACGTVHYPSAACATKNSFASQQDADYQALQAAQQAARNYCS